MAESAKLDKNLEKINKQIKEQMEKAWFDLLKEKTNNNPPDYDWLERLYLEIRDKLLRLTRENSNLYNGIMESMDIVLFSQMIKNNAFTGVDTLKLIEYVFEISKNLGSPARDTSVDQYKYEVLGLIKAGGTFGEVVPLFFKNANKTIDNIYYDLQRLKENMGNKKK
jgi:hypothetical protein